MGILNFFKAKSVPIESGSGRIVYSPPINMNYHRRNLTTALMLKNYGDASPILPLRKYPQYFSEKDYNIGNPKWVHQSLVQKNFLVPSTPEEILNSLKVVELKDILVSHSLSVTGRKADLVQRIIDSMDVNELDVLKKEKCYSLSNAGRKFLDDNYDYVMFHKHRVRQLSFEGYCSLRNKLGANKFFEIAEELLRKEINLSPKEAHIRFCYYFLSELYKEWEIPQKALLCLLYAQYIDLNSDYNHPSYRSFLSGMTKKKELLQHLKNDKFFIEGVVSSVFELREYFSEDMIAEIYSIRPVEVQYCNEAEFKSVVYDILDKRTFPKAKWTSYFVKNFIEYHQL